MVRQELSVGGAVVFWQLATANREHIAAALAARGHKDIMPEPPTVLACLKSSLGEEFPTKTKERIAIRPVEKGYAVVEEPPKKNERTVGDNWGKVKATATLAVPDDEYSLRLEPEDSALRQRLIDRMQAKRCWISATGVGGILVSLVAKLDGTSYRDNGVVYWMPIRRLDEWEQIADVIEQAPRPAGSKEVPMIHTLSVCANQKLLRAVCAGLHEEVTGELSSIASDIMDGDLGEEACLNRLAKADRLLEKVKRYETDMDTHLTELNESINKTQQALAWSTLQMTNSSVVRDAMQARC